MIYSLFLTDEKNRKEKEGRKEGRKKRALLFLLL
jgi:hypothetical protein